MASNLFLAVASYLFMINLIRGEHQIKDNLVNILDFFSRVRIYCYNKINNPKLGNFSSVNELPIVADLSTLFTSVERLATY